MNNFDGQIVSVLILALVLAWFASLWVARRYANQVLAFMQTGSAPDDTGEITALPSLAGQTATNRPLINLLKQNQLAIWRLRGVVILISLLLASCLALVAEFSYAETRFSGSRLAILSWVYAWPLVPGIGLLERWSRKKIVVVAISLLLLTSGVVMLDSNDNQQLVGVLFWLFSQQMPILLVILIMTSAKIRAIGPYLLIVLCLFSASSLLGFHALQQQLNQGLDNWLMDLVMATSVNFVFILFHFAPWLLAFYPARLLAKKLAEAYQRKAFSEPFYLLAGAWAIVLLFQAMTLSHGVGFISYALLLAWLIIPVSVVVLKPLLQPHHQPANLLLLRVFRADDAIQDLFDKVIERWRYSGNTLLIAGKDLALRNLEPDELFSFLNGQLQQRFISDESHLQQAVAALDLQADPDGRYRINEFFCFNSTWKQVLASLITQTDLVLMDLRGYNATRNGCSHELKVLASNPQLQKLVVLFDKNTDKAQAEQLLKSASLKVEWLKADQLDSKLQQHILYTLLANP